VYYILHPPCANSSLRFPVLKNIDKKCNDAFVVYVNDSIYTDCLEWYNKQSNFLMFVSKIVVAATLVILFVFGPYGCVGTETIFVVNMRGFVKPELDERVANAVVWCLDNVVHTDCDVRHTGYLEETRASFFAFGPHCTGDMLKALVTASNLIDMRLCFEEFKRTTEGERLAEP
jgi:hypothetical protein